MKKFLLFLSLGMFNTSCAYADKADLNKIENYLNNIKSLQGSFVQIASNGGTSEGKIYISKPSKIRMEYTNPEPLLIVGNGDYIIYNDKELDQITNIDYKDIPATIILTKKINFNDGSLKIVDLYKDSGQTSITVEMPKNPGVKPITLIFENEPFRLKQWKVIDQQNIEITVSLFDIEQDVAINDGLFKFDKSSSRSAQSKTKRK